MHLAEVNGREQGLTSYPLLAPIIPSSTNLVSSQIQLVCDLGGKTSLMVIYGEREMLTIYKLRVPHVNSNGDGVGCARLTIVIRVYSFQKLM